MTPAPSPVVSAGQRDSQDRLRRAVYLPAECWAWLDATARHDRSTRSDLLEGLVLLAMDKEAS